MEGVDAFVARMIERGRSAGDAAIRAMTLRPVTDKQALESVRAHKGSPAITEGCG